VLRLALEGHLTLSVNFVNHTAGRCGPVVPLQDAKRRKIPSLNNDEWIDAVDGLAIGENQVIEFDPGIRVLNDVWDLKMRGAERIDVEHRYQFLTDGPSIDLQSNA